MDRIRVWELRKLEKQVALGEISYSRMVEILNERMQKYSDEQCELVLKPLEDLWREEMKIN